MWHTQVVGQDGLFQNRARGHPITRLSTLQPIYNEFGHCETVQATETHWKLSAGDTVERAEDRRLGSQSAFAGTRYPDTRRKLPRGRLSHH